MHLGTPLTQHSLRRPNIAQQNINNDIINIQLDNTEVNNMSNFRKYCKCKLKQKKLLRDGNYNYKDTIDVDVQNENARLNYQSGYFEEEYVNGEINPDFFEVEAETPENNVKNLENKMQNLEINSGSITPEFEATENCTDKDENKSEINEKTDSQVNDEFDVVNNECFFDSNNILEGNEETADPVTNEKLRIIDNIVIKHGKRKRHDKTLVASDTISKEDNEHDQTAHKTNLAKQNGIDKEIDVKNDEIIDANNEISQKQIKNKEIKPTASTSKGITTQKTSKNNINTGNLADKSDYNTKNTGKTRESDHFKVPKEVTHTKKKIVQKPPSKFVLTHVIEGFIIQESNIAFPIRVPQSQKKKPKPSKTEDKTPKEVKPEEKLREERMTEETVPSVEVKDETIDQEEPTEPEIQIEIKKEEDSTTEEITSPTEVKETNTLNQEATTEEESSPPIEIKEEVFQEENRTEELAPEVKEEDLSYGECNPFARLQQSAVRSWTVEDLSSHLHKFHWDSTAALLEDNEVDGESLFMVTKSQLMIIGVDEEQADVISEFIQSGSKGH